MFEIGGRSVKLPVKHDRTLSITSLSAVPNKIATIKFEGLKPTRKSNHTLHNDFPSTDMTVVA